MNYRKQISNNYKYPNMASSTSLCLSSAGTKHMIRPKRQRNKTQYDQQQLTNIFHAYPTTLYCSPHLLLEKQHVERIFIDERIGLCCGMDVDVDGEFMGCCREGRYSIMERLIMSDLGSQIKEIGADTVISNISANIVSQKQQLKSNKIIKQFTFPKSQAQDDISVISNFEGGNMCSKIKISSSEYFLILKNDTNTQGYTQWFQFYLHANASLNEMQNEGKIIKFVIINIRKQIKYVDGMKLLTRPMDKFGNGHHSQNWQRNLQFVAFPTDICNQADKMYYGIAFCIPLKLIQNGIFVSFNYPYPFSRLKFLAQKMQQNQSHLKAIKIGKSSLGNPIFVFTHSAPIINNKRNRNVIILSRQHSSQISSSFICQFIIKKLAYFTNSQELTESINWHIIPIANPDGVIHGNSRTNIKGYDINRCWSPYLYHLSPEVQSISAYLQSISISSEDLMIDLHSHSRDFGVFTYANESNQFVRCFQDKMRDVCHYFDVSKCRIGRENVKINKFRVQMQTRLKVRNIITIETSYYGYISPENMQVIPFTIQDYNKLAGFILEGIEHYIKYQKTAQKQENGIKRIRRQQIKIEDQQSSYEQQNQSDSDPQSDYMNKNDHIEMIKKENTTKLMQLRQRNKKQNISQLYQSSSSRQHNNRRYGNKNNETIVNQINVINLYQASHNSQYLKQQQSFSLSRNRAVSACQRVNPNFRISMESSHRSKQVLVVSQNMKEVANERQQHQSTKITQRSSFKRLFACAQLRYSCQSQQFIRNISVQKQRKQREELRKSMKQKKIAYQHVKTLSAPFSNQNNTNQLIQLKQVEESLRKRLNSKNIKGFYFNKKQKQKIQVSNKKANDKIALLCQYAKKISCQQLFF